MSDLLTTERVTVITNTNRIRSKSNSPVYLAFALEVDDLLKDREALVALLREGYDDLAAIGLDARRNAGLCGFCGDFLEDVTHYPDCILRRIKAALE